MTNDRSQWQRPEARSTPAAAPEPKPAEPSAQPPQNRAPQQGQADPAPFAWALLVIAGLVVGGYFLIMELGKQSRLQDCLMQGRTNCAPIETK